MTRFYATWETNAPPPAWQPCSGVWVIGPSPSPPPGEFNHYRLCGFVEAENAQTALYLVSSAYPGAVRVQASTFAGGLEPTCDQETLTVPLTPETSIHAIRRDPVTEALCENVDGIHTLLWEWRRHT